MNPWPISATFSVLAIGKSLDRPLAKFAQAETPARFVLRRLTHKIRRVVRAARPLVLRGLRIWAQRTRTIRLSSCEMRSNDLLRRFALFHPGFDHAHGIESERTFAAGTVAHPGRHEQSQR